jgi:hypothetical protein
MAQSATSIESAGDRRTAHLPDPDGFLCQQHSAEIVSSSPDASSRRRNIPRIRGLHVEIAAVTSLFRSTLIGLRKEPALG